MQSQNNHTETDISTELVERIIAGDSQAEQQMVIRYQKGLNAMLYNRSSDKALSEDVAQDTWVLVIQKVRNGELKDRKRLAAFIIQIAKNQLIMRFRSQNKHQYTDINDATEVIDRGTSPEQSLINDQLASSVSELLNELKIPRDREIIRRFYLMGDEKSQLCDEFELSEAHFDRVLFRARERFKTICANNPLLNKN